MNVLVEWIEKSRHFFISPGWEDEEGLLAAVLAESQKEYLDSLKRNMKDNRESNKGTSPKYS